MRDVRSADALISRKKIFESHFITFIKSGLADTSVCLNECLARSPPLYPEIIFIHAMNGDRRKALALLLKEIGDISLAVDFIEDQLEIFTSLQNNESKRFGQRLHPVGLTQITTASTSATTTTSGSQHNPASRVTREGDLWNDLINFTLEHPEYLTDLFDNLGVSKLDAMKILSTLHSNVTIPMLKQRLMRVLRENKFKEDTHCYSRSILQDDALTLLCQKNHGQRRAMKVDPHIRCSACLRPLALDPSSSSNTTLNSHASNISHILPADKANIQIWGPRPGSLHIGGAMAGFSGNNSFPGTVIFSNKLAFHRLCYERLSDQ